MELENNFNIEQFLDLTGYDTENTILNIEDVDDNGYYDINDFLKMNNKEILDMNEGKRFGICLQNPPYDKGLHIKFLKKVSEISNKVISIQPITFLQKAALFDKKLDDNIYCDDIEILPIDKIEKEKYFKDTQIRTELGIITINDKKEIDFKKLNLFNKSEQNIIYKCIDYVKNNDTLDKHLNKKIGDDLILKFSNGATLFAHGKIAPATFRLCSINYNLACSKEKIGHIIYLNNIPTEEIRKNIYDFYNSNYLRYWIWKCCLSESQYKYIPYFEFDKFKNKWIESDYENLFINKIGLTDKEWKYYKEEANKLPR